MPSLKMPVVENGDGRVNVGGLIHDRHYPASLLGFHIKGSVFIARFLSSPPAINALFDAIRQRNRIYFFLNAFARPINFARFSFGNCNVKLLTSIDARFYELMFLPPYVGIE